MTLLKVWKMHMSVTENILPLSIGYNHTVHVQVLCVSYQCIGKHCLQTAVLRVLFNTLRTGLLNCLNARSRGLTFRHRASCI